MALSLAVLKVSCKQPWWLQAPLRAPAPAAAVQCQLLHAVTVSIFVLLAHVLATGAGANIPVLSSGEAGHMAGRRQVAVPTLFPQLQLCCVQVHERAQVPVASLAVPARSDHVLPPRSALTSFQLPMGPPQLGPIPGFVSSNGLEFSCSPWHPASLVSPCCCMATGQVLVMWCGFLRERNGEFLLRCSVLVPGSIGFKGADSYERELYGRTKAEIHIFAPSLDSALQVALPLPGSAASSCSAAPGPSLTPLTGFALLSHSVS